MRRHTIKIDGRAFTAVMNLNVMEEIAELARDNKEIDESKPLDVDMILKIGSSPYGILKTLLFMIREGERLDGRECDIDLDWIKSHIEPGRGVWMQRKVVGIMVQSMKMETEDEDDKEVDVVLEEIKKKETRAK